MSVFRAHHHQEGEDVHDGHSVIAGVVFFSIAFVTLHAVLNLYLRITRPNFVRFGKKKNCRHDIHAMLQEEQKILLPIIKFLGPAVGSSFFVNIQSQKIMKFVIGLRGSVISSSKRDTTSSGMRFF